MSRLACGIGLRRFELAIFVKRLVVLLRSRDNDAQYGRTATSADEVVASQKLLARPATQSSIPNSYCVCDDLPFTISLCISRFIRRALQNCHSSRLVYARFGRARRRKSFVVSLFTHAAITASHEKDLGMAALTILTDFVCRLVRATGWRVW